MTNERDLLRDLQAVLTSAEVDVSALVEGAWVEAQDEVRATLRRLMTRDLLGRALASLEGTAAPSPTPAAAHQVRDTPPPTSADPPDATPVERSAATAPPEAARSNADTSTYVFGIVGSDTTLPRTDLPRIPGGGPIRLLEGRGGSALVCDVDAAVFEVLRRPGPDGLDVLAAAAQAHDVVLARFVDAPVLPLPLGTVLPDDRVVTELLAGHAETLRAELDRLTGLAEWAVTVRTIEDGPPGDAAAQAAGSGRDYLEARRAALAHREGRWAAQEQLASAVHEPLAACAADAQEISSRPLEGDTPPLHHGVYLVADDARDRFRSTVDYLRGEHPGAVIEVTGPWPPYHFTAVDLSAGGSAS